MSVAWVGLAASVGGSLLRADSAGDAADAQVDASREATQLDREVFNKQVELNDPYRRMGLGAGNRLMTLLGLTPGKSAGGIGGGTGGSGAKTRDQYRTELLSKYTTNTPPPGSSGSNGQTDGYGGGGGSGWSPDFVDAPRGSGVEENSGRYAGASGTSTIDEAGLNAEIDRLIAEQEAAGGADEGMGDPNDPEFGSLMRDFSMDDFVEDPGYKFRLEQGQKGLERSAAARGGLLSGRAAKDMEAYSQGMGAQEYGAAYNRFQTNRSNKLNPLQSLMGIGQTGTGQITQAAQNFGNNASANITGAGNARASGYLAQGNAMQNAVNGGVSAWKNMQPVTTYEPYAGNGGGGGNYNWGGGY